MTQPLELSILMPCLNEAETLKTCIDKARASLATLGVDGEVLIADNGSTDGSQAIAEAAGARVVPVAERGYGAALAGGIKAARGRYIIMGDADDSYDFTRLEPFLARLRAGDALVMGNRFKGGIGPGAMPPLHRWLGNPVLTTIGRVLFGSPIGDFHCGLRGFNRSAMLALDLRTTGMEFASEMVVRATLYGLPISEVPTTLMKDGRSRPPHLRSWRDGWRHLRFLLMFSPRWLFLYPGLGLIALGLGLLAVLATGPVVLGGVTLDLHTMVYAGFMAVIGAELIGFALYAKVYAVDAGLLPRDDRLDSWLARVTLERGVILGALVTGVGIVGIVTTLVRWAATDFGALEGSGLMRLAIGAATLTALGLGLVFKSFFLGLLRLPKR